MHIININKSFSVFFGKDILLNKMLSLVVNLKSIYEKKGNIDDLKEGKCKKPIKSMENQYKRIFRFIL